MFVALVQVRGGREVSATCTFKDVNNQCPSGLTLHLHDHTLWLHWHLAIPMPL